MNRVMKNKKVIAVIAVVVLAAVLFASGVIASPPAGAGDPPVASKINYQGQLTDGAGNPLDGTYDMEFLFYNAATGGSQVGSTITKNNVEVTNGLFRVELDVDQSDFDGQGLWLEVIVEGETLSPRQEILPVPYALSLKPGAVIGGAGAGNGSIYLKDENGETVLEIRADLAYLDIGGPGNEGDIWVRDGADEIVLNVDGNRALVEIGGPGNEGDIWVKNADDETTFDVSGDSGRIKSGADSYIFISGNNFIKDLSSDSTRWDGWGNGGVFLWRGSATGDKYIYIPITVPGVLYGQNVKVEELTIYYKCQDGTENYISSTVLTKQTGADSMATIVYDNADRKSDTATSYTLPLTQNNVLSSDEGILGLYLYLNFEDDTNSILIGGARLRLSHSD